jgi:hypothetical protein
MGGIRFRGVYRANFSAFWRVIEAFAFYALGGIDDVGRLTLVDCLYGAFRFAGSATNALICDFVSHVFPPESNIENIALLVISKRSSE